MSGTEIWPRKSITLMRKQDTKESGSGRPSTTRNANHTSAKKRNTETAIVAIGSAVVVKQLAIIITIDVVVLETLADRRNIREMVVTALVNREAINKAITTSAGMRTTNRKISIINRLSHRMKSKG